MPVEKCQCHRLAILISPWLYSDGAPPTNINRVWNKWLETRQAPTQAELNQAIKVDKAAMETRNAN